MRQPVDVRPWTAPTASDGEASALRSRPSLGAPACANHRPYLLPEQRRHTPSSCSRPDRIATACGPPAASAACRRAHPPRSRPAWPPRRHGQAGQTRLPERGLTRRRIPHLSTTLVAPTYSQAAEGPVPRAPTISTRSRRSSGVNGSGGLSTVDGLRPSRPDAAAVVAARPASTASRPTFPLTVQLQMSRYGDRLARFRPLARCSPRRGLTGRVLRR